MALAQEMQATGNWLFRWRSFVPLPLVALLFIALGVHEDVEGQGYDDFWEAFCLAVSLAGLVVRCYTVGHAPRGTSGRNTTVQKAEVLNTTGLYSVVRHPLYLGNYLMWLGIVLFVGIWWLAVICTLMFWIYYERIMYAEETFLGERFGRDFQEWAATVPAFIPNFRLWRRPALPFSLKIVLQREYSGLLVMTTIFFALDLADDLIFESRLEFDPFWSGLAVFGFVTWMVLRVLRKTTAILHVPGR